MKTMTTTYAVDEFGQDEAQAPRRFTQAPPTDHFKSLDGDEGREALLERILPCCPTDLHRRVAWAMVMEDTPVTIPEFRAPGVTRRLLTQTVRDLKTLMQTGTISSSPITPPRVQGVTPMKKKVMFTRQALTQLATGKIFTFSEFRDQLAGGDEGRAKKMIQLMPKTQGAQFLLTKTGNTIDTIQLGNVPEMVKLLQA